MEQKQAKDFKEMTSDSIGKDLLSALLDEIRLLPKPWEALSQEQQNEIIDRLRLRVMTNVKMAVHLISSEGRITIPAQLDQVTLKDEIKALFKVSKEAEGRHELMEAQGLTCLIVVGSDGSYVKGIHDIKGESDQREMDLGHEYHDNDGGGMDEWRKDDDIIEGELVEPALLPAPEEPSSDDPFPEDPEQSSDEPEEIE